MQQRHADRTHAAWLRPVPVSAPEEEPGRQEVTPVGRIHAISPRATGEGPRISFAVYLSGCPQRCVSCLSRPCTPLPARSLSVDAVAAHMRHFAPYMAVSGGGLTVTGGEPLDQMPFVAALLRRSRAMGISTALHTSGAGNLFRVRGLMALSDHVIFDVSGLDRRALRADPPPATVRSLQAAARSGRPLWLRFAPVAGLSDDPDLVEDLAAFSARLPRVDVVRLDSPDQEHVATCPLTARQRVRPPSGARLRVLCRSFQRHGLRTT